MANVGQLPYCACRTCQLPPRPPALQPTAILPNLSRAAAPSVFDLTELQSGRPRHKAPKGKEGQSLATRRRTTACAPSNPGNYRAASSFPTIAN
ncbi:hypothetical protein BKA56DRAFT_276718 [Ilyonectria sp. MPI-CAGE-AT-0026]|nr:hypothetical protein BKA56DRAFT_276718 [Ilyonectria sp. MPI-CAGE-AT-0026]